MIEVAAAIIEDAEGRILIARKREGKPLAGYWEFPGGKIEKGETVAECLVRELQEEMSILIEPYAYFGMNEFDNGKAHIQLIAYRARYVSGSIELVDHDAYAWVEIEGLSGYSVAPADVKFVEMLWGEDHANLQ
jgi:8-oxo-dGTP diphosphatase